MRGSSFVVLVIGMAAGCGDDSGSRPPVDAGGRDTGSMGSDSGGGEGTLSLEVRRVLTDGETTEPAMGARVVMERPGGGVEETTAGADGRVTFSGLDFALGTATVSAWLEGHVLTGIQNLGSAGFPGPLYLLPITTEPESVTLSGAVSGVMDPAMHFLVLSSTTGGYYEGRSPYTMEVPSDEAGDIVAFEVSSMPGMRGNTIAFHQASIVPFMAVPADVTLDIDFSTPATMMTVTGSIPTPSSLRAASALNTGDVLVRVTALDASDAFLGAQTRLVESGMTLEYDVSFVQPTGIEMPRTSFIVTEPPDVSGVFTNGWPSAGMQDVQFLDPPTVLAPDFGVDASWSDTIRWESVDIDEHKSSIQVYDEELGFFRLRAITVVMPGSGSAELPLLPDGVTLDDVLDGTTPSASITTCDPEAGARPWSCGRFARGREFGIAP